VTFDSNRPVVGTVANKNNTIGIWARGKNIAVRNCTFLNTSDAINANSQPQGLLVQDNTAPLATGIRGYFLWYEGEDGVVLGNTVANSTRERPMRMNAYNRVLIAYNDFTDLDRTSVDPSDGSKGSLWAMEGENVYIAHNDLHGILQTGPNFGINPITGRVGGNAERTRNLVVEANTLDSATRILHGVTDSIFRNNIAVVSKVPAFCLEAYSSDYQRQVENTIFANNTVINNTTIGSFMLLNGAAKGLQLLNNLYVANNLATGAGHSGGIISYTGDVSQFSKISGNVWSEPNISWYDKGKHYLWPTWFDNRGQIDAAEWEAFANVQNDVFSSVSLSSSYAPTSGAISTAPVVPGVFADFNGKTRPSGSWTAGAIQL